MKNHLQVLMSMHYLLTARIETKETQVGPCVRYEEKIGVNCPDDRNIRVYLFTRRNREYGQCVAVSEKSDNITDSNFNPRHPNKLIIHGFNADMNLNVLIDLKEEYLQTSEMNVWMVDYPRLVENSWCYVFAVMNIAHVGHCLAQLVRAVRRHSLKPDIHVVGFSLGAQVANYIARSIGEPKIDRITGLDPAGLLFAFRDDKYKLDASDAKFVDIVHTNGLFQGTIERSGHVDFFMNGGVQQPGCEITPSSFLNCNHRRAVEYFRESLRTKAGFFGWPCDYTNYLTNTCFPSPPFLLMGEHCPIGSAGFYIVPTAVQEPFALGGNFTHVEDF